MAARHKGRDNDRAARAGAWAIVLACKNTNNDLNATAALLASVLDTVEPQQRWLETLQKNPALLSKKYASECADFVEAVGASSDAEVRSFASKAYARADAAQQQSAALILASGAAALLIIGALRFKMIKINKNGITVEAYKPDKHIADGIKAATGLLSSILAPLRSADKCADESKNKEKCGDGAGEK